MKPGKGLGLCRLMVGGGKVLAGEQGGFLCMLIALCFVPGCDPCSNLSNLGTIRVKAWHVMNSLACRSPEGLRGCGPRA